MTQVSPAIQLEQRGEIVLLRLVRPHRRNAPTQQMIDEIQLACAQLSANEQVRVVILTGSGGAFCAGLDLIELANGRIDVDGRFVDSVRHLPQATIAAIDGPAVTGGLELALACDIRLGSRTAKLADTHVRVGMPPGGGASVALSRIVGIGRAKEMSLSGRYVFAEEADRWGLLNGVVDGNVVDAAFDLADQISSHGPFVRNIKSLINDGLDLGMADALANERRAAAEFMQGFEVETVVNRYQSVIDRGRLETAPDG